MLYTNEINNFELLKNVLKLFSNIKHPPMPRLEFENWFY